MGDKIESEVLAEGIINKAIQEIVFKYNAYAPIISSFRIAYTDLVPTMGVDKYARLIANPEFVVRQQRFMKGIIIHEVLHVFFGHTNDTRSKLAYTEDPEHNKLVNIAEDCAINQFISEDLPEGTINPNTLEEMLGVDRLNWHESAEYYYDKIIEALANKEGKAKIKIKGAGVSGEGGNSSGGGGEAGEQEEQEGEQGGGGELENEICSTDKANSSEVQDALDKMGIEHLSQEEVNDSVLNAAKEISKSQGGQYGQLAKFALELLEPKVDWKPLLQATIRNAEKKVWSIHSKSTYKRVSRRSGQILLPKKYGNKISVVLTFDTSGSISSEMVCQFLSEVKECMKYSEIKECSLWHTSNYWYGTAEELEKKIEKVFQSGGTDEACMGEAEHHCKADLYIHFSDGYHGDQFGFEHPNKNIEIVWDGEEIKEIRKEF